MTDLVVRGGNTDLARMTLSDLADVANTGHDEVQAIVQTAVRVSLVRAFRVGDALLEARRRVPFGEWMEWLQVNVTFGQRVAQDYQRLAQYKEYLVDSQGLTQSDALESLRGLPSSDGRAYAYPSYVRRAALELRQEGLSLTEVGRRLGVSHRSVWNWEHPDRVKRTGREYKRRLAEKQQRYKAAQEVLATQQKREKRILAAAKSGKALSKTYAELRVTLEVMDQAILEATNPTTQIMLRKSRDHLYKAEDQIAQALGVE